MDLIEIYANVGCSKLQLSAAWFGRLLGPAPDAAPMAGLVEWHHGRAVGLQLLEDPARAGRCALTLIVGNIRHEHERLERAGLAPGAVEEADNTAIVRLDDPDGNSVVMAQRHGA
ncbi:VOC family protein [Roseitranquillus sediminis]|uniref:VOC family protein n=1 Tax=Roseitranquillus sediminis TaxID=2809051 RepID=UPI001D0C00B7|nr:hypothetical protein [Roseitranquillus sediminis]MBM9596213.1 hypothetical protein [Roseitranquillus sediminis]